MFPEPLGFYLAPRLYIGWLDETRTETIARLLERDMRDFSDQTFWSEICIFICHAVCYIVLYWSAVYQDCIVEKRYFYKKRNHARIHKHIPIFYLINGLVYIYDWMAWCLLISNQFFSSVQSTILDSTILQKPMRVFQKIAIDIHESRCCHNNQQQTVEVPTISRPVLISMGLKSPSVLPMNADTFVANRWALPATPV